MASIRKRTWTTEAGEQRETWAVYYRDQDKVRRYKSFDTKREAEAWKVNALHEVQQGTHTPASASKTIEEAWRMWLADTKANLERSTYEQRRQHLEHHVIKLHLGNVKLSDLTTPRVYEFDTQMREDGRSLAMRKKVMTHIKTMIGFAQGRGLVAQN